MQFGICTGPENTDVVAAAGNQGGRIFHLLPTAGTGKKYNKRPSLEVDWGELKAQAPAARDELRRYTEMSRITNE